MSTSMSTFPFIRPPRPTGVSAVEIPQAKLYSFPDQPAPNLGPAFSGASMTAIRNNTTDTSAIVAAPDVL